jgi:hypothetical protein
MKRYLIYLWIIFKTRRYKNLCGFKNGVCINVESCCTDCRHLKDSKCSIVCVHCNIWFCQTVCKSMSKKDYLYINKLYDLADRYDMLDFRSPFNIIKVYKKNRE